VGSAGTVVPDGGSHAVPKKLVNNGWRHHASLPFINITVIFHGLAPVEAVNDFIRAVFQFITDNRHSVPEYPYLPVLEIRPCMPQIYWTALKNEPVFIAPVSYPYSPFMRILNPLQDQFYEKKS